MTVYRITDIAARQCDGAVLRVRLGQRCAHGVGQLTLLCDSRLHVIAAIAAIYRGNIPFMVIFPCEIAPCILPEKDIFQIVVVKISVAGSNGGVAIVRGNG